MNRTKLAIPIVIAAALAWPAGAPAQADDPAVAACEMLVREELPNTTAYRQLAAEIAGSTVVLSYETRDAGAAASRKQTRCVFAYSAATASWGFAPGLPEALSVAVMGALIHRGNYPIPRELTALRPAP